MATNHDVEVVQQDNTALMKRPASVATVVPLVDIYETPEAFMLMIDLPGARKDSISVTTDKSSLVIRAAAGAGYGPGSRLLYNEIPNADFHRSFNMTDEIDRESIDARFENGVLTLKLLKKEESKPREIRIR